MGSSRENREPQQGNPDNANGKLQIARQMIEQGPAVGAPSRLGLAGRLVRRLVLRGMRPFTFYQRQVDNHLVSTLQNQQKRLQNQQKRLQRFGRLAADTRKREKAIEGQLDQIKKHLGALERATTKEMHRLERGMTEEMHRLERGMTEEMHGRVRDATEEMDRLDAELSGITSALRARPDLSHPLLSYTDESGKVVLGFQNAEEDGPAESEAYRALEAVLRGDEQAVRDRQAWYAELLADRPWVLNVGCGRGEFLDALRERGTKGKGVDSNEAMVGRCQEKGHDVTLSNVNTYLLEQDDGSVPAIFAAQTAVEHLSYDDLLEFLRLANAKLEAEGLLIFEAVNYHSLEALKAFWLDPSNQHPTFPEVALALCRLAGFRAARVVFPNGSENLKRELPSAHQYAVLATRAPSDPVTQRENSRRAALGKRSKSSGMRLCKVCDLPDWEDEEFQAILDDLHISWAKERKHRKGWEWAKGIQGLERLGVLKPEARAIGVGAGHETPLYYLANRIGQVHATDIYGSGAFVRGEGSGGMLSEPEKFAPFYYREDHLVVRHMDGCNLEYPDESFEIAFSFSSVEHFGGHEAASEAMREMGRVLRPGGVAAITTEVILNGQSHPEFFLPEELYEYLVRPSGLELVEKEIDFTISPTLVEKPIDMDAFVNDKLRELWAFARCDHTSEYLYDLDWSSDYGDVLPYIVLKTGPVVFTSVLMFLRKPD